MLEDFKGSEKWGVWLGERKIVWKYECGKVRISGGKFILEKVIKEERFE